jgi:hypothetical protein
VLGAAVDFATGSTSAMERRPPITRWERDILPIIPAASVVAIAVALSAVAVSRADLLSDDLVRLEIASRISWWEPMIGDQKSRTRPRPQGRLSRSVPRRSGRVPEMWRRGVRTHPCGLVELLPQ